MLTKSVDRTKELELKKDVVRVVSEDTCGFWKKRFNTQVRMRRCFYCEFFVSENENSNIGLCSFGTNKNKK